MRNVAFFCVLLVSLSGYASADCVPKIGGKLKITAISGPQISLSGVRSKSDNAVGRIGCAKVSGNTKITAIAGKQLSISFGRSVSNNHVGVVGSDR